jgi:hypothetical protein
LAGRAASRNLAEKGKALRDAIEKKRVETVEKEGEEKEGEQKEPTEVGPLMIHVYFVGGRCLVTSNSLV